MKFMILHSNYFASRFGLPPQAADLLLDVDDPSTIPSMAWLFILPCVTCMTVNMMLTESHNEHILTTMIITAVTINAAPSKLRQAATVGALSIFGAYAKRSLATVSVG